MVFNCSGFLTCLTGLNLSNNPLVFPPKHVIETGVKVSENIFTTIFKRFQFNHLFDIKMAQCNHNPCCCNFL